MLVGCLTKFMHLIKIYLSYGRLTVLITDSIYKVIPFMIIFLLWTVLFSTQLNILKSNESDAQGYEGIPLGIGFVIVAFENGVGNIAGPTVDHWLDKSKETKGFTEALIVYGIYIVWFLNQFILLIVLLNFVIALISEVYERVMDQRMIYEYQQK